MTIDPAELGALGAAIAALGAGLWRGLVLILGASDRVATSMREIMQRQGEAHERMHAETTTALRDNAVATTKHASAIEGLSRAVEGLHGRVATVERHIERAPTGRFEREPEPPTRVAVDPAMRRG